MKNLRENDNEVVTKYKDSTLLHSVQENILGYLNSDEKRRSRILKNEEVVAWLPIPPIPGDLDWGDKPYEAIPEIQLKPIAELKH